MRLAKKVAIITGAGNGLGKAAAYLFAREGAKVVVADFLEEEGKQVVEEIVANGSEAMFVHVDVTNKESVEQLVEKTKEAYGTVDILVNNAGVLADGMLHKLRDEDWKKVLDVNLTGVFYCAQAVIPTMLAQGSGKIINTSSVSGVYGNVGQTNYAATKAGVVGMTKSWAKELGPKGINVNAVAPGFIETRMTASVPPEIIEKMKAIVPLQRLGKPEEIAHAYLFLASDEASYVNGAVLHVDGGIMM